MSGTFTFTPIVRSVETVSLPAVCAGCTQLLSDLSDALTAFHNAGYDGSVADICPTCDLRHELHTEIARDVIVET